MSREFALGELTSGDINKIRIYFTYVNGITIWKHLCRGFCKKVQRILSTAIKSSPPPMWHMHRLQHALCAKVVWHQHSWRWAVLIAAGKRTIIIVIVSAQHSLCTNRYGLAWINGQLWGLAGHLSLFSVAIETNIESPRALSFPTHVGLLHKPFVPFD